MWEMVALTGVSGLSNYFNQEEQKRQAKQHNKNIDRMIDSNTIDKAINRQNAQANEAWANKMIKKYGGDKNRTEAIAESYTGKTRALGEANAKLTSQQHQLLAQKVKIPKFNWGSLIGDTTIGAMQGKQMGDNRVAQKKLNESNINANTALQGFFDKKLKEIG